MKKAVTITLSIFVGVMLFGVILGYAGLGNILNSFRTFSLFYLMLFLLTSVAIILLSALRWGVILKALGHNIRLNVLSVYKIIGVAIGYLTPTAHLGGEPVRGYLLKKEGVPGANAFASLLIDLSSETVSRAIIGVIGIIFFLFFFDIPKKTTAIFIVGLLVFSATMFMFYSRLNKRKGVFSKIFSVCGLTRFAFFERLNKKIEKVEQSTTYFLRFEKKSLLSVMFISLFIIILLFVEMKFALLAMGLDLPLLPLFLIIIFITLTNAVPIPASLGILEVGQMSAFSLAGLNPYYGVAFSLLLRFRDSLWSLLGLILLSHQGINFIDWIIKRKNGYNSFGNRS